MDQHAYLQHDGLALGELVTRGEVSAAELLIAARTRAREAGGRRERLTGRRRRTGLSVAGPTVVARHPGTRGGTP